MDPVLETRAHTMLNNQHLLLTAGTEECIGYDYYRSLSVAEALQRYLIQMM